MARSLRELLFPEPQVTITDGNDTDGIAVILNGSFDVQKLFHKILDAGPVLDRVRDLKSVFERIQQIPSGPETGKTYLLKKCQTILKIIKSMEQAGNITEKLNLFDTQIKNLAAEVIRLEEAIQELPKILKTALGCDVPLPSEKKEFWFLDTWRLLKNLKIGV